jgi:hypothetical protein
MVRLWSDQGDSRGAERTPQLQIFVQVAARSHRAALCAVRLVAPLPERSPSAPPWRERPPEMTAWRATPAATDVVAHATLKNVGAHVGDGRSAAGLASVFAALGSQDL